VYFSVIWARIGGHGAGPSRWYVSRQRGHGAKVASDSESRDLCRTARVGDVPEAAYRRGHPQRVGHWITDCRSISSAAWNCEG